MRWNKEYIEHQIKLANEFGPAYIEFRNKVTENSISNIQYGKYKNLHEAIARMKIHDVLVWEGENPRSLYAVATHHARKLKIDILVKVFPGRISIHRIPDGWWEVIQGARHG